MKQVIKVLGIFPITSRVESEFPVTKNKNEQTCLPVFLGRSRSRAREISATWEKEKPTRRGQKQRVLLKGSQLFTYTWVSVGKFISFIMSKKLEQTGAELFQAQVRLNKIALV